MCWVGFPEGFKKQYGESKQTLPENFKSVVLNWSESKNLWLKANMDFTQF